MTDETDDKQALEGKPNHGREICAGMVFVLALAGVLFAAFTGRMATWGIAVPGVYFLLVHASRLSARIAETESELSRRPPVKTDWKDGLRRLFTKLRERTGGEGGISKNSCSPRGPVRSPGGSSTSGP